MAEEERIDIQEMLRALQRDRQRIVGIVQAQGQTVSGAQAMGEIGGTLIPYLQDVLAVVAKIDEWAAWAGDKIEEHDDIITEGPSDESQLLPDDADKVRKFTIAVRETCQKSLEQLPAGSPAHHGLQVLLAGADEILALVNEIEIHPEPADADQPPLPPQAN